VNVFGCRPIPGLSACITGRRSKTAGEGRREVQGTNALSAYGDYMSGLSVKRVVRCCLSFFCSALRTHSSVPALPPLQRGAQGLSRTAHQRRPAGLSLTKRAPRYAGAETGVMPGVVFSLDPTGRSLSAGSAPMSMARAMIASAYIRQLRSGLPLCCMHGRSRGRDGTHLSDGRLAAPIYESP
jgi:hypothetical protein